MKKIWYESETSVREENCWIKKTEMTNLKDAKSINGAPLTFPKYSRMRIGCSIQAIFAQYL